MRIKINRLTKDIKSGNLMNRVNLLKYDDKNIRLKNSLSLYILNFDKKKIYYLFISVLSQIFPQNLKNFTR